MMSNQLFDLTGKTALVTGATHGLGMAISTALANAGATVIVNDVFAEKLETAKKEYADNGIHVYTYALDVTNEEAVEQMIPLIEKEVAPIDILVNNAGIIKRIPILEMKADEFRQVVDVDLTGPFIMSKTVAKGMVARGHGKIINMCSMMSELGRDTVSAYAAAKGGLKMLTRRMPLRNGQNIIFRSMELGRVTLPRPKQSPSVSTDIHLMSWIISRTPAGRWGEPEDLVGAAIFLASKASDFVNGHILYVDGGILATIGKPANEN